MNPQEAHDIVNKEINVILKGCCRNYNWNSRITKYCHPEELCPECISTLRGIISQEATEIEFLEPHFIGRSWEDRLQALKISMADLQEKVK